MLRSGQDGEAENLAAALWEGALQLRQLSIPFGTRDLSLRPALRPQPQFAEFSAACSALVDGVDGIIDLHCDGDLGRFGRLCHTPAEDLELLIGESRTGWAAVARPDIVVADGRIAVVEPNAAPMAGLFAFNDMLNSLYRGIDRSGIRVAPDAARPTNVMPSFADMLRRRMVTPDGVAAICFWRQEQEVAPQYQWHYETLRRELCAQGIDAVLCSVEELELGLNGVALGGQKVSVVYRYFDSPAADAKPERDLVRRLCTLVAKGSVGLVNGFLGEVAVSKACMPLLSDETYTAALPTPLAHSLKKYIPWSRFLAESKTNRAGDVVDLLPWVSRNRESLVLKPVRGNGGVGVVIGREVSQSVWEERISTALASELGDCQWLVQEMIVSGPVGYAVTGESSSPRAGEGPVVASAFMVEGRFAGLMHRHGLSAESTANINGTSGFSPAPVWWV